MPEKLSDKVLSAFTTSNAELQGDVMDACKLTGKQADEEGSCPQCGDDTCIVQFTKVESFMGLEQWKAWFLRGPGMPEQQVTREDYLQAESGSGFYPKLGCGPEATASFGAASGLRGRNVSCFPVT